VLRALPKTGYFRIHEAALLPWRPLEFRKVEYQLQADPQDGIVKADSLKLETGFLKFLERRLARLHILNLSFSSETLDLQGFDLDLPLELSKNGPDSSESGFIRIDQVETGNFRLQNISILFQEAKARYTGDFELKWLGGRSLPGQFEYEPYNGHKFSVKTARWEINLSDLSEPVGSVFERATGRCEGSFRVTGGGSSRVDLKGTLVCPRPGGRVKAKFLKDLSQWIPDGAAKKVFQEEVEGKEDYYYDEARIEVHNDTPGYWTFHLMITNPRLRLDIPIDISENSFAALLGNTALQDVLKKWSESHG